MLEETSKYSGLSLPKDIGGVRLEAVSMNTVISIAPFKGQSMTVADTLRPLIDMILPPVGKSEQSAKAQAYWYHPGQWLVLGEAGLMRETSAALSGMAAVAEMSDTLGKLSLAGNAAVPVLSRLCALDLEAMTSQQVAHTCLSDIPVTLLAVENGFELLMPRSYTTSAVERLEVAMRSVAALSVLQ